MSDSTDTSYGPSELRPALSVLMSEFSTPEHHFDESIRSVLNQSFQDFELIIVDDCGSNDVSSLVRRYQDPRIRIIRNRHNMGLAESLQMGLRHAMAPLIARVDTDDMYDPLHFELLVAAASQMPEFAVYSSLSIEFSDDGRSFLLGRAGEKSARDLMRGDVPAHPATLIRTEALRRVGGYPLMYRRAEDLALWFELVRAGERILVTEAQTHHYRVNLQDYSKRRLRHRGGELRARIHYYPLLGAAPYEYLKILRSLAAGVLPPRLIRAIRGSRSARLGDMNAGMTTEADH